MPRTASDALHQLIHSLDRTEKGYVKRYCSRHVLGEGNDYVRLFDLIETQDTHDEAALKRALKGSPMLKRLPSVKNYLYQQILEAMRNYHAAKSPEREITELLLDADFLWEKTLYDQAMKRVYRAKELAAKYDEFAFWLKTIAWEKNYRSVIRQQPDMPDGVDPLGQEQERIMHLLARTIEYEHLGNLQQYHLLQRSNGDTSVESWLASMPNDPLLRDVTMAVSRPARLNYHLILANWHAFVARDPHAAAEHAKAGVEFLRTQPDLITARPDLELGMLQLYLQFCVDARDLTAYRESADLLWDPQGRKPSKNIDVKRFYRAMITELGYAAISKDASRISGKMAFLRERFIAFRDEIPAQSRIFGALLAARFCVEHARPGDAAWWLTETLSIDEHVRTDLHVAARLLQMRLADEARDTDLLRSLTRSLTRFMTARRLRTPRLDAVVSYYRRRAEPTTPAASKRLWNDTARRLAHVSTPSAFDPVSTAGFDEYFTGMTSVPSRANESVVNY
jgi:hypothetical protein